jgi:hypothetical protein
MAFGLVRFLPRQLAQARLNLLYKALCRVDFTGFSGVLDVRWFDPIQ